ncbi:OmpA family protein [Acerihabitans sp. KWT182]|uniref:OmpA family protein n=1 Tax=Acerihabitans sp. KWT182 TaxID=3157919 RepID=A0AAU7QBA0_9GAMM
MTDRMRRGFWLFFGGLTLMMCQSILPWGTMAQGLSSVIVLTVMAGAWINCGKRALSLPADAKRLLAALPRECSVPIVLVSGDNGDLDKLFGLSLVRETSQGCYLRLGAGKELARLTPFLLERRPTWGRQLAAMFLLSPQSHTDMGALRIILRGWRHEILTISRAVGYRLPAITCLFLNGNDSPWYICPAEGPFGIVKEQDCADHVANGGWPVRTGNQYTLHWSQAIEAEALTAWCRDTLLTSEPGVARFAPADFRAELAVRFISTPVLSGNVWQRYLPAGTLLRPMTFSSVEGSRLPFPDPLLLMLARPRELTAGQRALAWGMALLTAYCLALLCIVAWNNQRLLTRVAADLQQYSAIPASAQGPKASALAALIGDAGELELYHRQGTPLRLGLGLYSGARLYAALLTAIDGYTPPSYPSDLTHAPRPFSPTINLDSLSLFNTGSADLKPDAAKKLVAALVDIKAQPGWMIVVDGHTDDTGNSQRNRALSLARAEAVRDWLRDMGNIPSGCFAVQGHGAARPITGNDTAAGRAANRRVDIKLIPEPGACQPTTGAQASPLRQ